MRKDLCSHPMAAITNSHKLSSLKQHRFIILQFWKAESSLG